MLIVVVFFSDGDPEIIESKDAISFLTETMQTENVTRVVFAKSKSDAQIAKQVFGNEWRKK